MARLQLSRAPEFRARPDKATSFGTFAHVALLALGLLLTACGHKTSSDDGVSASGQGKAMVLAPGWVTGTTWPTETVVALNSIAARTRWRR